VNTVPAALSENLIPGEKAAPRPRILVADDEPVNLSLLDRVLTESGYYVQSATNGQEALQKAQTDIPDLLLLDVAMPTLDGLAICRRLRENVRTRGLPIILLTGRGTLEDRLKGFRAGADDYVLKPFDMDELKARVEGTLERRRWNLWTHPLTRLPGSPAIEDEVRKRLAAGGQFAFAYADIDNFKAYNDAYGYEAGDHVIQQTADLLIEASISGATEQAFAGHIGGDDFVLIAAVDFMKAVLPPMAERFDRMRDSFYKPEHLRAGGIRSRSRLGEEQIFPLMTLSIAVASNHTRRINHYAKLAGIVSELKPYVKQCDHRQKSLIVWDRRRDDEDQGPTYGRRT